jgi:SAM-dependent methyltransferase
MSQAIPTSISPAAAFDDRLLQPDPRGERAIDQDFKRRIRDFYDDLAAHRPKLRRRNSYYHKELVKHLRFLIPPGKRILEIGCGDGWLLRQLSPSCGLGVDLSPGMIRQAKSEAAPDEKIEFRVADVESVTFNEKFDFVLMSDLLGTLSDVQAALENVRSACDEETRIVINFHSILWEPLLKAAGKWKLKAPQPKDTNWLSPADIDNFVTLSDFELIRRERRMLLPKYVPLMSELFNGYLAPLPLFNKLCLSYFVVLRKRERPQRRETSVTVLIPCRNERGNIRAAIDRLPRFGTEQEVIFVDGHSTDGTPEEIERVIAENPRKDIRLLRQTGKGKGDAVRLGFAQATRDVLMILDADLTMPPEDLPKFYDAIARGKGEFINGSRLVYPMEKQAMRFLNILGNVFFSKALTWLLNQRLKDTLCGTKVLRKRDYERIVAGRSFFGDFDPFGDFDLLFGASKLNLKIVEIPIRYRDRTYGTTNISRFKHGWLLLKMTLFAFRKLKRQ